MQSEHRVIALEQPPDLGERDVAGGDGQFPPTVRAGAAAVLVQGGHEDRVYDVTGPEALTAADLAALAGEVGGHRVEAVAVDDDAMAAGLRAAGLPQERAELVVSFGAATRLGFFAHVSPTVADLTGRPATPLADLLRTTSPTR